MPSEHRAGRYLQQSTGYRAFLPAALPPEPPVAYSGELQTLLSTADRDLARLDAIASLLPNPDLFVAMYVRHQAVLSSQIEGTQITLEDVLTYEADAVRDDTPKDVAEVVNYVRAMNHGLTRLPDLPLSLRLLREIHAELMQGVRGGDKSPGEFRTSQKNAFCTKPNPPYRCWCAAALPTPSSRPFTRFSTATAVSAGC